MNLLTENGHAMLRQLLETTAAADIFAPILDSDDEVPVSFSLDKSPSQIHDNIYIRPDAFPSLGNSANAPFYRGLFEILPSEILSNIAVDWLTIQDISRLDIATSSPSVRNAFLTAIGSESTMLFGSMKNYGDDYVNWLNRRSISIQHFQGHHSHLTHDAVLQDNLVGCFNTLTHMDLQSCIHVRAFGLCRIISRCFNLTSLNLSTCRVTDQVLEAVCLHLPSLRSLGLMGNSRISDRGIYEVAKKCTDLKSLNLSYCSRVTSVGLLHVFSLLPGLLSLQLACCKIGDASLRAMADFCPALKRLDVDFCEDITAEGIYAILGRLKLESIDLPTEHTEWMLEQFYTLLHDCPSLKRLGVREYLDLSDNDITVLYPNVVIDRFSKRSTFIRSIHVE